MHGSGQLVPRMHRLLFAGSPCRAHARMSRQTTVCASVAPSCCAATRLTFRPPPLPRNPT